MASEQVSDPLGWGTNFQVSAPGKIILHGDHSVVYGKTALAASLGLRTELKVISPSSTVLGVNFPSVGLQRIYSTTDIKKIILELPSISTELLNNECIPVESSLALVRELEREPMQQQQETALACFFHVILCTGYEFIKRSSQVQELWPIIPAAMFHIESKLPVGSGAGSSAAFCVCLATASFHLLQALINGDEAWGFDGLSKDQLQQISLLANSGEKLMHGHPSGVDSAVCTYGGVVQFKSGKVEPIGQIPLRVLLVDSGVARQTKAMVMAVRERLEHHPSIVSCILDAMDKLALQALEQLKTLDEIHNRKIVFRTLEELVDMNQGLLWSLGVSHPSLDEILLCGSRMAQLHGKLTGAGGGGLAFMLLPNEVTSEQQSASLQKLKVALNDLGFLSEEVELGGPGIAISPL